MASGLFIVGMFALLLAALLVVGWGWVNLIGHQTDAAVRRMLDEDGTDGVVPLPHDPPTADPGDGGLPR